MQKHTSTQLFRFEVVGGVSEFHAMLRVTNPRLTFIEQLEALQAAYEHLVTEEVPGAVAVLKRYFLSDAANQSNVLLATQLENSGCALSVVEQPPLDGSQVALWVYLQTDVQVRALPHGDYEVSHGGYRHLWSASNFNKASKSEYQTRLLFLTQNLTEHTHFIASTGIAGRHADHEVLVQMDAYAVGGLQQEQIHFLYAPTHLNPTYEYGVSFERGTYVDYGDRRQVFISGTASINNRGEVMYPGDIRKQTLRMWENVEVLLAEAECSFEHVGHLIIYLRDIADYAVVQDMFEVRFPAIPKVYLQAPVCRPGWLIEMECMAVKAVHNEAYAPY